MNVFLFFSGSNDRAIFTLANFMFKKSIEFKIVARNNYDSSIIERFCNNIIYRRDDDNLSIELFKKILQSIQSDYSRPVKIIFTPTSEFINLFVLKNREILNIMGLTIDLINEDLYLKLTNKYSSINFFKKIKNLHIPYIFDHTNKKNISFPCIIKPKNNLFIDKIYYPYFCNNYKQYQEGINYFKGVDFFVQTMVDNADSFYLCGFLKKDKQSTLYWQANLIQQINGKSMILAKTFNPNQLLLSLQNSIIDLLVENYYFGPFMIEILIKNDNLFFIEMNPRFWGPLELSISSESKLLESYLSEYNLCSFINSSNYIDAWYSYAEGFDESSYKSYPITNSFFNNDDDIYIFIKENNSFLLN